VPWAWCWRRSAVALDTRSVLLLMSPADKGAWQLL
jgi:hypothetical protein